MCPLHLSSVVASISLEGNFEVLVPDRHAIHVCHCIDSVSKAIIFDKTVSLALSCFSVADHLEATISMLEST